MKDERKPLGLEQLLTFDSYQDHQTIVRHLADSVRSVVVIDDNGMCSNGRIINYLQAMLADKQHNTLIVGYQTRATPGHATQFHVPNGRLRFL